jgi:hypothetical protein
LRRNEWLLLSKVAPTKPIVVLQLDATKLEEIVKKVDVELGKSGEAIALA